LHNAGVKLTAKVKLLIGGAPDLAHGALSELGGDAELGNLVDSSKAQGAANSIMYPLIHIAALYRQTSRASPVKWRGNDQTGIR
jgi:hypothetical protein